MSILFIVNVGCGALHSNIATTQHTIKTETRKYDPIKAVEPRSLIQRLKLCRLLSTLYIFNSKSRLDLVFLVIFIFLFYFKFYIEFHIRFILQCFTIILQIFFFSS